MADALKDELDSGSRHAIALVDHIVSMGATSCLLPVVDRAVEYVVLVMPKEKYAALQQQPIAL